MTNTNYFVALPSDQKTTVNLPGLYSAIQGLGGKTFQKDGSWYITGLNMSAPEIRTKLANILNNVDIAILAFDAGASVVPSEVSQFLGVQNRAA